MPRGPKINEPKNEINYTDEDEKLLSLNAKAIDILYYALNLTKFNRVSECELTE